MAPEHAPAPSELRTRRDSMGESSSVELPPSEREATKTQPRHPKTGPRKPKQPRRTPLFGQDSDMEQSDLEEEEEEEDDEEEQDEEQDEEEREEEEDRATVPGDSEDEEAATPRKAPASDEAPEAPGAPKKKRRGRGPTRNKPFERAPRLTHMMGSSKDPAPSDPASPESAASEQPQPKKRGRGGPRGGPRGPRRAKPVEAMGKRIEEIKKKKKTEWTEGRMRRFLEQGMKLYALQAGFQAASNGTYFHLAVQDVVSKYASPNDPAFTAELVLQVCKGYPECYQPKDLPVSLQQFVVALRAADIPASIMCKFPHDTDFPSLVDLIGAACAVDKPAVYKTEEQRRCILEVANWGQCHEVRRKLLLAVAAAAKEVVDDFEAFAESQHP